MPSGDSITYDLGSVTRKGSPGAYKYMTTSTADDGRITRNVADFNGDSLRADGNGKGWRVIVNFQGTYRLDSIKYYDRSGSVDTVRIFTFKDAPAWDTVVNPEDYSADYTIESCGSCAGLPVTTTINATANDTVKFVMLVLRRTELFSGLWPDISQLSFYGTYVYLGDTTYDLAHWAFTAPWTAKPIDSIVGSYNLQNQQDTLWHDTATADNNLAGTSLRYHSYFRSFDQMFFDDSASKHDYKFNLGGDGNYTAYKYSAALARRKNFQFAAIFNDNAYYKEQLDSIGHTINKSWGVNTIYDDPQEPESYSRKGQYMGFLAKHGGGDANVKFYPTYNGTMQYGNGYLRGLGTNNEPTLFAFANAWKNAIMVAAEAHGVYDSIKLADASMPVLLAGFEAFNYDDAKASIFCLKLLARSRTIKSDGISFHGIHTLKTDSFDVIPTSNQQIFNHGISVGYWRDWEKIIHYVQGCRREVGSTTYIAQLDEDGHQKGVYKRKPLDAGETFSVSQLGTPRFLVAGVTLDAYNSHAVACLQDMMVATASPLYKHYWYTAVDDVASTSDPAYDAIDGNNGLFDRPLDFTDHPESWPADYASAGFRRRLGRFYFVDSFTNVTRGLHVFKYVHSSNADSLLYIYAALDSVSTGTFEITGLNASSGIIVTPSFTSRTATESSESITAGEITITYDPMPRGFIVYSPSSTFRGWPTTPKIKGPP
jgi:hypothetical protein